MSDEEALQKAIQASIAEAGKRNVSTANTEFVPGADMAKMTQEEAEHQAMLEKAIQESLALYAIRSSTVADVDSDEDEDIKLALRLSKEEPTAAVSKEEEELKLALQKSKEELARSQAEEEIVLEYVRKQSLLEEEHRGRKKSVAEGKNIEASKPDVRAQEPMPVVEAQRIAEEQESAADEEALQKAIEESMKSAGDGGMGPSS